MGKYREINPKKLPGLNEGREESLKKRDLTYLGKNTENEISNALSENGKNYKIKIRTNEMEKKEITVFLSWKRDEKSVINWMRKHMETYPEIRDGFLVRFIDDNSLKWYEVIPCDKDEDWEKIGWTNYKIISYTYEK